MNRFFHKGLFYKEWITAKWFMFLLMIEYLFAWIWPYVDAIYIKTRYWADYYHGGKFFYVSDGKFTIILFTIIIIVMMMFSDRQKGRMELLCSMPYTREQIIGTKWIVAIGIFLVPLCIAFGVFTILHFINESYIGHDYYTAFRYRQIVKWFFINLSGNGAIISFLFFIQSIGGNYIISSIIGSIFLILPFALPELIYSFLRCIGVNLSCIYDITDFIVIDSKHPILCIILCLLLVMLIFTVLMFYTFKKNDIEKNGCIAVFKRYEIILKMGITICTAMVVTLIINFTFGINTQPSLLEEIFSIVVMSILTIVFYKFTSKVFDYYQK